MVLIILLLTNTISITTSSLVTFIAIREVLARAQRLDILHIELVLFMAWVNSMAMTDSKDRSIMDLDLVDKLTMLDKRKELVQRGLG